MAENEAPPFDNASARPRVVPPSTSDLASTFDYDLICIGSGPAGQRAAVQAAKFGYRAAVVEKRRMVGGVCLETGTIPSKTFREAVLMAMEITRRDKGFGFAARIKPQMEVLVEGVAAVLGSEAEIQREQLQRNDVNIILGRASFEDPHTLRVETDLETKLVTARHILVSVGTKPSRPPGVDPDGRTIMLSDSVLDLDRLPRTMVVVGAGVIGLEYASMFAALGVRITVVDRRTRPLEFMDHELVDELIHQLRNGKTTFRLGESVASVERVLDGNTPKGLVRLESGKQLLGDVVLFSTGRVGATDTLCLDAAGLEADQRGRLRVDSSLRTSQPHIYAAGDVIGFPSLAATSSEQGRRAACYMFSHDARPMAEHFPVGIYAVPEMSMVGTTEEQLTADRVPYEVGLARYRDIARGQILGDDTGFLKMLFHRDERRLLGVHAIGTGATELIHIGQAVLVHGGGLDYFLENVFNYPTLAECYKVAALDAANKLRSFARIGGDVALARRVA